MFLIRFLWYKIIQQKAVLNKNVHVKLKQKVKALSIIFNRYIFVMSLLRESIYKYSFIPNLLVIYKCVKLDFS